MNVRVLGLQTPFVLYESSCISSFSGWQHVSRPSSSACRLQHLRRETSSKTPGAAAPSYFHNKTFELRFVRTAEPMRFIAGLSNDFFFGRPPNHLLFVRVLFSLALRLSFRLCRDSWLRADVSFLSTQGLYKDSTSQGSGNLLRFLCGTPNKVV